MALTYPRSLAQFLDTLRVAEWTMEPSDALETGQTGRGEVIASAYGTTLWEGTVTVGRATTPNGETVQALINALRAPEASFLIAHPIRRKPYVDPTGSFLGSSTPVIGLVYPNNLDIQINGLPVGYVLTAGDFVGWTYDTSRRALHQVVETRTTDGSGVIDITVSHPVRGTVSAGTAVTILDPVCKAKLVPGSINPRTYTRRGAAAMSFQWRQTLAQ